MRNLRFILSLCILASVVSGSWSQVRAEERADTTAGIVNSIMASNTEVMIIQPDELSARLLPTSTLKSSWSPDKKDAKANPNVRYRVQVFSDNNRHSAKTNAEYRKNQIEQRIPGIRGYVTYDSPYWRVRMGNYLTEAEAQTAMKLIKSKFPSFAGDVRIVRVRVKN